MEDLSSRTADQHWVDKKQVSRTHSKIDVDIEQWKSTVKDETYGALIPVMCTRHLRHSFPRLEFLKSGDHHRRQHP